MDWTSASARQIQVYTSTGTNLINSTNATTLTLLPTTAGAGLVYCNTNNPASKVLASLVDGIAFGSGSLVGTAQWSKPTTGDSGFIQGWLFNDGTSGGSMSPTNTMTFTGTVSSVGGGSW